MENKVKLDKDFLLNELKNTEQIINQNIGIVKFLNWCLENVEFSNDKLDEKS